MAKKTQPNDPSSLPQPKPAPADVEFSHHEDDLGDFALTARVLWEKYGANTMLVILVAILAFMAVRWYGGRQQRMVDAAYTELAEATDPIGKEEVAGKYESIPGFASGAYLQAGDLRLREAVSGSAQQAAGNQPKPPTPEEKQRMLDEAAGSYQKVLDLPQHTTLQTINARFGLAAVRETQGQFDKAGEQYKAIEKDAAAEYPSLAAKARKMDESLARISAPVIFPPAPPKAPEAAGPAAPGATPGNLAVPSVNLPPAPAAPAKPEQK